MVTLFHGHGQENVSESRVDNGRRNLFDKRMKTMKMKYGQDSVRKPCK